MNNFFRYPHTPHLAWLAKGKPRDDKLLKGSDIESLLSGDVIIEEKIDGANLGISIREDGVLLFQNRGQYILQPFHGQFAKLRTWISQHEHDIQNSIDENLILFGEWAAARHSIFYESLPDLFIMFDVYDRCEDKFWSTVRRNEMARKIGLSIVPQLFHGMATIDKLISMTTRTNSAFAVSPLEGIVIRNEDEHFLRARAKIVRPDFSQNIGEHWMGRAIEWNIVTPLMTNPASSPPRIPER